MNKETSIDLSTILGIFTTFVIIIYSINSNSSIASFIDYYSLSIVIFGTFLVTSACFSLNEVLKAHLKIFDIIIYKSRKINEIVFECLKLAELARKNGIVNFENKIFKEKGREILKRSITLTHQGYDLPDIEKMLEQEIFTYLEGNEKVISILRKSAEIAPAMGLIGTLIGLVQMLGNLNDASTLGPSMAIALLTTFYGALLSYVLFFPLASKIEYNSKLQILIFNIYIKTALSIIKAENPRYLESDINSLLSPGQKVSYYRI